MKQSKNLFISIITVIVISCSSNNNTLDKLSLTKIEKITSIKEFAPTRFYKQPKLYILNDYLFIYAPLSSSDKKVDIYDKNSFKYLTSCGIKGGGPGEISATGPMMVDGENNCFWLCDFGKMLIYKFPIDSVFKITDYKPSFSYKLPTGVGFLNFYFETEDTIVASTLQLAEMQCKIKKICLVDQTLHTTNYEVPQSIKSDNHYSGMSSIYMNPSTGALVCGFYYSDLILFMDDRGNILKSIEGPLGTKKLKQHAQNNSNLTYSQVTGNEKYIFALFNGNKTDNQNIQGASGKYIRIFSSNGDYIKTLELEDNLAKICYDEDKKRIIAISNDRENSLIYFDVNL